MSRPQATTAFMPISNRSAATRPAHASILPANQHGQSPWYNITSKKKAGKVTADIAIFGEIGWEVRAQDFIKELNAIEADKIVVSINSVGGDVFDGVAIYNALRLNDAPVTVNVVGLAASAASFIAQAGDEVYMLRGSEMMIHDAAAFAWGNAAVMRETAGILDKISNSIADIYAQRAGGTLDEWRAIMQAEMWYSPDEAVAAGLADEAITAEDEDAVAAKDSWDLRVFNYAGRKDAPSPVEESRKIINRAKEALMGNRAPTPSNEGEQNPTPVPEAPAAPEAPAVETEPEGDTVEEEPPVEETPPVVVPEVSAENREGVVFTMGGQSVIDPVSVQNYINVLETFYNETRTANRSAFIAGLASGPTPKIAATQIAAMEELVATMDDKQYDLWRASWDAAPNVALLGSHGNQDGGSPQGTAASALAEEVDTLKEIVNYHKMGGMKPELIKNTDSYKKLMQLQPEFTL